VAIPVVETIVKTAGATKNVLYQAIANAIFSLSNEQWYKSLSGLLRVISLGVRSAVEAELNKDLVGPLQLWKQLLQHIAVRAENEQREGISTETASALNLAEHFLVDLLSAEAPLTLAVFRIFLQEFLSVMCRPLTGTTNVLVLPSYCFGLQHLKATSPSVQEQGPQTLLEQIFRTLLSADKIEDPSFNETFQLLLLLNPSDAGIEIHPILLAIDVTKTAALRHYTLCQQEHAVDSNLPCKSFCLFLRNTWSLISALLIENTQRYNSEATLQKIIDEALLLPLLLVLMHGQCEHLWLEAGCYRLWHRLFNEHQRSLALRGKEAAMWIKALGKKMIVLLKDECSLGPRLSFLVNCLRSLFQSLITSEGTTSLITPKTTEVATPHPLMVLLPRVLVACLEQWGDIAAPSSTTVPCQVEEVLLHITEIIALVWRSANTKDDIHFLVLQLGKEILTLLSKTNSCSAPKEGSAAHLLRNSVDALFDLILQQVSSSVEQFSHSEIELYLLPLLHVRIFIL
jgi:hypothetical protein